MGLSGANLAATYFLLALPALLGCGRETVLLMSFIVVSVQAGQAAAVQTGAMNTRRLSLPWLGAVIVCIVCATRNLVPLDDRVFYVVGAGAGVLFGTYLGGYAATALGNGRAIDYQLLLLSRNTIWASAVLIGTGLFKLDPVVVTAASWTVLGLWFSMAGGGSPERKPRVWGGGVWVGALAALVYRNDVNVSRGFADASSFDSWHYGLIVYAFVQSIMGFLVVNEFFSRRETIARRYRSQERWARTGFPLVFFGACAVAGAIVAGQGTGSVVAIVWIACLSGMTVSVQAAVAHCLGHSLVVYIAGTLSFAALFVAGTLGATPGQALVCELVISGIIVAFVLFVLEGRPLRISIKEKL
jgi:hypothetical protein